MSLGLALGKFAPLHKGHQLVLDEATASTGEQIFVIYDSPHVTKVPLGVRANWLRQLYPAAHVIEAWGGPQEVGLEPGLMLLHEEYLLKILGSTKVTHFFSSEPYGEHVSKRLGAVNVQVDVNRSKFPVSGSVVRQDYFQHRSAMDPLVYRDLVAKIVFLGAPGSGKSTITELCAKHFQTSYMPEYGREYWEANEVDRKLTQAQLQEIALGHIERENFKVMEAKDFFFVDTDASTTAVFSDYYHQQTLPELADLSNAASRRYDLTFLCMPDFEYVETEDRSGEVVRLEFHSRITDKLLTSKRPFIELGGTLAQRLERVQKELKLIEILK
jgi:NadR type nicotinamide-nucleotide adenylyltransferase